MGSRHLRLNPRVLTVFLIVGLPILALGVMVILWQGQARLTASQGEHLSQVAQQVASAVDTYVFRRILDISLVGRTPDLRAEAARGSAQPFSNEESARRARSWPDAVWDTAASRYLADLVVHDRIYREALLTDRYGRIVAASHRADIAFVGDEDWWKSAAESGQRGGVSITDVRWDEATRTHILEVAVPVEAPDTETLAGVLKVVVDSRELLALVGGVSLGSTGDAVLLRDNGSVVFSRRTSDPNARFFARDALVARLDALRDLGPDAGTFFTSAAGDTSRVVGLASSQLGLSYPNLGWIVAVSQAEDELLAPVRSLGWYLLLLVVLLAAMVLGVALYFSMRLAVPTDEVAPLHLVDHPVVGHVGDEEEPAAPHRA
ncbi:MAG: hypothetical protein KJ066_00415 [Acidobacteria bacterium]|nr:hypothetical protein [Acidobacteriota bacterium]